MADRETAEIDGRISAFTSLTQFVVSGIPLDASAASYPNGSTGIVLGARVEVEGSIRNSMLVAQKVKLESDEEAEGYLVEHGNAARRRVDPRRKVETRRGGRASSPSDSSLMPIRAQHDS